MDKFTQDKIDNDNEEISKGLVEYPDLAVEEVCPHTSHESIYIGDGDSENTCRVCDYNWVTSNCKYQE